jgi:hypothetical protein
METLCFSKCARNASHSSPVGIRLTPCGDRAGPIAEAAFATQMVGCVAFRRNSYDAGHSLSCSWGRAVSGD